MIVTYFTEAEVDALLNAPNLLTWCGRRDQAMLRLAVQTGLRISELSGLTCHDLHLGSGPYVACNGKGSKERITPLTATTVNVLAAWIHERGGNRNDPLFPTRTGRRLSRDTVQHRIAATSAPPPPPARPSPPRT